MGEFVYDTSRAIEVEDRALAHLQVVIIDKLRRDEHFAVSLSDGKRLTMMWVGPSTPLQFIYHGSRVERLNRAWIEALATEAGISGVLALRPEPPPEPPAPRPDEPKGVEHTEP
jgi:hypothetical protein